MAKIVVIVPVYNVEQYLERCIKSVLNQSFDDFKLILVNDGSTDSSGEICETYKWADERIELIEQENMGLSMARNIGLESSTGKYVTFLDSDDYIHRDMLKILYENMVENDANISICEHEKVYEGIDAEYEEQENHVRLLNNIESVERIVKDNETNMIVAWGKLYSRYLFEEIRYPKGKYHEDEFVTYKLLYKAEIVVKTTAKLHYYTQRDKSITGGKYSLKRLEKLEGLKEAIEFFKEKNENRLELYAKYRYLLNVQIAYYRVKLELNNEKLIMKRLKDDYDKVYKGSSKDLKKLPLSKKIALRSFYMATNLYCHMVNIYMKTPLSKTKR